MKNDYKNSLFRDLTDLACTAPWVRSLPVETQERPFCLTEEANSIPKYGAHVGQHLREIAIAAILYPASINSGDDFETYRGEDSGGDETDSEDDGLRIDGRSEPASLFIMIIPFQLCRAARQYMIFEKR